MNIPSLLGWARSFTGLLDHPAGQRANLILGTIQANWERIQTDTPAIQAFLDDLLPVIQRNMKFFADLGVVLNKHWKPVLQSSNDLLPIIETIVKESK